jgi:hypothetical protein
MNREAMGKLRLDRRLIHRPCWISKAELEKEFEALPDVSDKIAPPEASEPAADPPVEEADSAATGEPGATPDPVWVE